MGGGEGGREGKKLRKKWISPVIDFRNAISYLASRFCDPLKRRSNFPIANLINDKDELWSRTVTPVANIFISRHRFAFSLRAHFPFPPPLTFFFLSLSKTYNLATCPLTFVSSFRFFILSSSYYYYYNNNKHHSTFGNGKKKSFLLPS